MLENRFLMFLFDEENLTLPFLTAGYLQDKKVQEQNIVSFGDTALCPRCEGTGNEFILYFKSCTKCNGTGLKDLQRSRTKLDERNRT